MKRFSIRELLLLMFVVSLALGWWVDRRNTVSSSQQFQLQVAEENAFIIDSTTGQSWQMGFNGGVTSPDFLQPKSTE